MTAPTILVEFHVQWHGAFWVRVQLNKGASADAYAHQIIHAAKLKIKARGFAAEKEPWSCAGITDGQIRWEGPEPIETAYAQPWNVRHDTRAMRGRTIDT